MSEDDLLPPEGNEFAAPQTPPHDWSTWHPPAAEADPASATFLPPGPAVPPPPAPGRGRPLGTIAVAAVAAVVAGSVGVAAGAGIQHFRRSAHPIPSSSAATGAPNSATPPDSVFPLNPSGGDGSTASPPSGGSSGATSGSASPAAVAKVSAGVVDINTRLAYQHASAAGTGMVLTRSGVVLTNNHVVEGATTITATVVTSGRTYTARVVGTDPTDDIAVLQLVGASGLKTISVGDPSRLAQGAPVIAVGNAGGVGGAPSVVTGTVEAVGQSITASDQSGGHAEQLTGLIQTNAPIQPGDSGGPLADSAGQVVGMDTAASSGARFQAAANVGFAIPIDRALSIANQIRSGQASDKIIIGLPGFLGVQVAPADQSPNAFGAPSSASGALVSGAEVGSPAAAAGLTAGDTITSVDGQHVDSAQALSSLMQHHHPGDRITLGWTDSAGAGHTARVTLITGPAA